MRIKTTIKKLSDAEACKVSLVGHAANRIPFRIIKSAKHQENGMINLSRIFKGEAAVETNEEVKPSLVAVVVQKSDASDALKADLAGKGFEVETVIENDDETVTYVQKGEELNLDEQNVVRQSDGLLLVVKGFKPWTDALTAFADIANAQGFFPGMRCAGEILCDSISREVSEADNPADAAAKVGATIDAYKSHVLALIEALPSVAFKMELPAKADATTDATTDAPKIEAQKAEETTVEGTEAAAATENKVEEPAGEQTGKTVEAQPEGEQVQKSESDKGTTDASGEGKAPVEEPKTDAATLAAEVAKILKNDLDGIVQKVDALQQEVGGVKETQQSLQNSLQEVARKSESVEAKLKGTVMADPTGEDVPGRTEVQKKDFVPLGDTAFDPKNARLRGAAR